MTLHRLLAAYTCMLIHVWSFRWKLDIVYQTDTLYIICRSYFRGLNRVWWSNKDDKRYGHGFVCSFKNLLFCALSLGLSWHFITKGLKPRTITVAPNVIRKHGFGQSFCLLIISAILTIIRRVDAFEESLCQESHFGVCRCNRICTSISHYRTRRENRLGTVIDGSCTGNCFNILLLVSVKHI